MYELRSEVLRDCISFDFTMCLYENLQQLLQTIVYELKWICTVQQQQKKIKTKHRPITYIFLILKFVFIRKNITNFYILSQVFLYIVCTGTDLIGMYVGMCFFFQKCYNLKVYRVQVCRVPSISMVVLT